MSLRLAGVLKLRFSIVLRDIKLSLANNESRRAPFFHAQSERTQRVLIL
jgi:hypothetical protein